MEQELVGSVFIEIGTGWSCIYEKIGPGQLSINKKIGTGQRRIKELAKVVSMRLCAFRHSSTFVLLILIRIRIAA